MGITIVQNNGWAAGQVIFHLHVHVIPMKPDEGFTHGKAYHDFSSPAIQKSWRRTPKKSENIFNAIDRLPEKARVLLPEK